MCPPLLVRLELCPPLPPVALVIWARDHIPGRTGLRIRFSSVRRAAASPFQLCLERLQDGDLGCEVCGSVRAAGVRLPCRLDGAHLGALRSDLRLQARGITAAVTREPASGPAECRTAIQMPGRHSARCPERREH